jgi:hypothetical protein
MTEIIIWTAATIKLPNNVIDYVKIKAIIIIPTERKRNDIRASNIYENIIYNLPIYFYCYE